MSELRINNELLVQLNRQFQGAVKLQENKFLLEMITSRWGQTINSYKTINYAYE